MGYGITVATALTACGIETFWVWQYDTVPLFVATALTACGIETGQNSETRGSNSIAVATALTACGIETRPYLHNGPRLHQVATALTACGIETQNKVFFMHILFLSCNSTYRLRY